MRTTVIIYVFVPPYCSLSLAPFLSLVIFAQLIKIVWGQHLIDSPVLLLSHKRSLLGRTHMRRVFFPIKPGESNKNSTNNIQIKKEHCQNKKMQK